MLHMGIASPHHGEPGKEDQSHGPQSNVMVNEKFVTIWKEVVTITQNELTAMIVQR